MHKEISEKYIELFGEESVLKFTERDLTKIKNIAPNVKRSLMFEGLPYGAAPEFQFDRDMEVIRGPYISIGDGKDFRPILLHIESGSVYEDFGDENLNIINSELNIFQLCLILYAEMIEKSIELRGSQAYLDNNIPDALVDTFKLLIMKLDPTIFDINSFWEVEIERLFSHEKE